MKRPNITLARNMRRQPTDAEKLLWLKLVSRQLSGLKFRRQHTIGHYIVDFICVEKMLIIEIDGGQHAESPVTQQDEQRTAFLEGMGYRVLRFWNNDVLQNIDGVGQAILQAIDLPSPNLSLKREEF